MMMIILIINWGLVPTLATYSILYNSACRKLYHAPLKMWGMVTCVCFLATLYKCEGLLNNNYLGPTLEPLQLENSERAMKTLLLLTALALLLVFTNARKFLS